VYVIHFIPDGKRWGGACLGPTSPGNDKPSNIENNSQSQNSGDLGFSRQKFTTIGTFFLIPAFMAHAQK
jgi:hypothetical protein